MEKLTGKPPMSQANKLCLVALAGILITTTLFYELTDGRAIRTAKAETDKSPAITITTPSIDCTPLVEAIEAQKEELYWQTVPLDLECREALQEACETHNVPLCLALGLIEVESGFQPDAVGAEDEYGLCQLSPKYFSSGLTPAENIQTGVAYLGKLLEKYNGDIQAALRAYNRGFDDGDRAYPLLVLAASEKWGNG